MTVWYIKCYLVHFFGVGIMYQEKSGNPGLKLDNKKLERGAIPFNSCKQFRFDENAQNVDENARNVDENARNVDEKAQNVEGINDHNAAGDIASASRSQEPGSSPSRVLGF
jgi:hypothetical protein